MKSMRTDAIERVLRAIEDVQAGKMVVLVDDEHRENEGDLCMAAELVTPQTINFMATHGRGLICLAITEETVRQLGLSMMVERNASTRSTAFTISIEARHGVSTGISAADRAHTIRTAVAPHARPADLVSPGHVFPLRARPGGVLQRTGHTEGSVDLARLAGCQPAGVICEIMKEDGTMARYPDLVKFADEHGLRILAIADLIQYRLQTEGLVRRVRSLDLRLARGTAWRAHLYEASVDEPQFLALTLGEIDARPTLVRVHTGSVLGDVFGVEGGLSVGMPESIERIEREGRGVVLYIPGRVDLAAELALHAGDGVKPTPPVSGDVLREYGLGAQVLANLGLSKIRLLTNRPRRIAGLEAFGLEVVEQLLVRDLSDELEASDAERTTH